MLESQGVMEWIKVSAIFLLPNDSSKPEASPEPHIPLSGIAKHMGLNCFQSLNFRIGMNVPCIPAESGYDNISQVWNFIIFRNSSFNSVKLKLLCEWGLGRCSRPFGSLINYKFSCHAIPFSSPRKMHHKSVLACSKTYTIYTLGADK